MTTQADVDNSKFYFCAVNIDPSVEGFNAPQGAIVVRTNMSDPNGEIFQKLDDGFSTNWVRYSLGLVANPLLGTTQLITALEGLSWATAREIQYIAGDGGPVTVTADPQIAPGTKLGQELYLQGKSDVDTVTLQNGMGLLLNGDCILKNGSTLILIWDGAVWNEFSRNDL